MAGDNDKKEMEMVRRYGCRGIHTVYGEAKPNLLKRLLRFAPENVALKNLAPGSNRNKTFVNVKNPNNHTGVIVKVSDPRQIFDVLNIHPTRRW